MRMIVQPILLCCSLGNINFCISITTPYTVHLVLQQMNPCILLDNKNRKVHLNDFLWNLFIYSLLKIPLTTTQTISLLILNSVYFFSFGKFPMKTQRVTVKITFNHLVLFKKSKFPKRLSFFFQVEPVEI